MSEYREIDDPDFLNRLKRFKALAENDGELGTAGMVGLAIDRIAELEAENDGIIADQARKIRALEDRVKVMSANADAVRLLIYRIGGPLNDNVKRYTSEQLKDWQSVINILDD